MVATLSPVGAQEPAPPRSDASLTAERCVAEADDPRPTHPDALAPSTDLFCLRLLAAPRAPGAAGVVVLQREPGPFTVTVLPDGRVGRRAVAHIDSLPDPASLGDYRTFVAWIADQTLTRMERLGEVGPGTTDLGLVARNKYLLLISAEADPAPERPSGAFVLRGQSPSTRMVPADYLEFVLGAAPADAEDMDHRGAEARHPGGADAGAEGRADAARGADGEHGEGPLRAHRTSGTVIPLRWSGVPMPAGVTMLPALMRLRPGVEPYLPRPGPGDLVLEPRPRQLLRLADGDSIALEANYVRRRIGEREFVMYGFNGQLPGPLIQVDEESTITVGFTNRIDWPTSIHWHGIRLENRYDGVPGVTQDPVPSGGSFRYEIHFEDAGIYWYHPHHREEVQQDLGLYGNLLVRSPREDWLGPAHREEVLVLDDLLLHEGELVPFGRGGATHLLNGRFGNLPLVNGEPDFRLAARPGEVVRLYLTNVSNTRTWNLSLPGAELKLVGSDVGTFEREERVESVPIAPAERYIVDVRFPDAEGAGAGSGADAGSGPGTESSPGAAGGSPRRGPADSAGSRTIPLLSRVQAIDHVAGRFFPEVDTLGLVTVSGERAAPDLDDPFATLREPDWMAEELAGVREHLDRPVDRRLILEMRPKALPLAVERLMQVDSAWFAPVEWSGTMPMMNWASTVVEVEWVLRDPDTGRENLGIDWRFPLGSVVKLRLHNRRGVLHAMQHPIHLHGQRFLVVAQDGVPNDNLVWKDTVLIPVGSTVDILLENSNPGRWMLHCHIAEHLEAGMKTVFTVGSGSDAGGDAPGHVH